MRTAQAFFVVRLSCPCKLDCALTCITHSSTLPALPIWFQLFVACSVFKSVDTLRLITPSCYIQRTVSLSLGRLHAIMNENTSPHVGKVRVDERVGGARDPCRGSQRGPGGSIFFAAGVDARTAHAYLCGADGCIVFSGDVPGNVLE